MTGSDVPAGPGGTPAGPRGATGSSGEFGRAVAEVRGGADPAEAAAGLLAGLTDAELLGLLDGDEPFWPGMPDMMGKGYNLEPIVAGALPRVGLPGIRFSDGPRGAVIGRSTAFPVPMARGATWDPALEQRVGEVIGAEIRAQGGNLFAGVCINLLRHPAWGRAQETYGEEPALLGAMGAALARGAQRHVMACVKHYACNSMENARFTVDVRVDERALHEVYLPHFRAVVDAGVSAVMSAYNSVNGEWCGQNRTLLTEILRAEWGFAGFVMSDFIWGLRDPVGSVAAGLDLEMPFAQQRARTLSAALASGELDRADAALAARRIVATQLRFAAGLDTPAPGPEVVASAAHRALAREVAGRSMVLLRNEPVGGRPLLPLDRAALRRVAVLGRLADLPNTGDHGSSDVRAPEVVTPLAGLRAALPAVSFVADAAWADVAGADAAAPDAVWADAAGPDAAWADAAWADVAGADAAVVVVGYTAEDEGEFVGSFDPALAALYPPPDDPDALAGLARAWDAGPQTVGGDRGSLRLHPADEELIRTVAAANPRTVVVVVAGAAVTMESWRHEVPAVLLAWYPGMEGGAALADVLLGDREPGGRLPFAVPRDAADLPPFERDATSVTYDRWHGQRLLDRTGTAAAYPLGFGLSYTSFAISDVSATVDGELLTVRASVTNTGDRASGHVVQAYATRPDPEGVDRFLVGFARVEPGPGERVPATIEVPLRGLAIRAGGAWRLPPGRYRLDVAAHAADPQAVAVDVKLPA